VHRVRRDAASAEQIADRLLEGGRIKRALARNADAEGATALTDAVAYLNRLADFLFVLARFCNRIANIEESAVGKSGGSRGR